MRVAMVLLPLAMMATESSLASVREEADVAMLTAVGEAQTVSPVNPPSGAAQSPPAGQTPRVAPPSSAPAHVPLPVKTITIRTFEDIDDIDEELESARRQASEGS